MADPVELGATHSVELGEERFGVAFDLDLEMTNRCSILQPVHRAFDDYGPLVDDCDVFAEVLYEVELV